MGSTKAGRWKAVRVPFWLTVVIFVALALRVADVWPLLPETVGSHFAADGRANDFMSKAGFFWVMGLIGGGTVMLLFVIPIFLRRLPPTMINLPNRDYWLGTPERQMEALDRLSSLLGWISMATAAILAIAIEFAIEANLHGQGFANGPFLVCLAIYMVFVAVFTIQKTRSLSVTDANLGT